MGMDTLTFLLYLSDLFAPALALGLGVSFLRISPSAKTPVLAGWARFMVNTGVGCVVLLAGLIFYGQDGKMATYAALVLSVASSQWFLTRAWGSR